MQEKTKVIFAGSGEFSWPVLEGLLDNPRYEVVGVLTQPHKPQGREQVLSPAFLERTLSERRPEILETVKIYRPVKLRLEAEEILNEVKPDLIVVAAYGQIIPNSMLEFSQLGCVNFHGSILPKLRGAVPVPLAILQGLEETGVTLQRVVAALDAGDIIAIQKTQITAEETAASLMSKLADIAKTMVGNELADYVSGKITPIPQNHNEATFCVAADIAKEKAEIKVETDTELAERMVRAFNPWPVAWIQVRIGNETKRLKVFKSIVVKDLIFENSTPGKLIRHGKNLFLNLQNGVLQLHEIQLEGKRIGPASDYLFLDGTTLVAN